MPSSQGLGARLAALFAAALAVSNVVPAPQSRAQTGGGSGAPTTAATLPPIEVSAAGPAASGTPALPPPKPDATQATSVHYTVDAVLAYFDTVQRADSGAIDPGAAVLLKKPEGARTLGLKRMRLGATWRAADSAAFSLVLRPDALSRADEARRARAEAAEAAAAGEAAGGDDDGSSDGDTTITATSDGADAVARDFDGRAGTPYRAAPPIRLLDSYVLTVAPARSLSASAGVFEELAPRRAAYPACLEFGLETRLPTHLSAVRLRWQRFTAAAPVGTPKVAPTGIAADAFAYDGNEDRAEALGPRQGTYDSAPVARDPYHGGALALAWYPFSSFSVGLTGGSHDSHDVVAAATGGEAGRVNEAYGQLTMLVDALGAALPLRMALDARYARERWRGGDIAIASRTQNSLSLTFAAGMNERHWLTLGAHTGRSDDDPSRWGFALDRRVPIDGYQVDLGYLAVTGRGLELQLMVAHERRQAALDGNARTGAFFDEDGENHATARRFGLQLLYSLDEET